MKKAISLLMTICLIITITFSFSGCDITLTDKSEKWARKFDVSSPKLENAGVGKDNANIHGWYETMNEEFKGDKLPEKWGTTVNYQRNKHMLWCKDMVSVSDGYLKIGGEKMNEHKCSQDHPRTALSAMGSVNTGVNDTASIEKTLFEQAFGYFEIRCKVPNSDAMWGSFWLQSQYQGRYGDGGEDGCEIDVMESAFYHNKTKVGSCLHYDGYFKRHRSSQAVHDVGVNTFEGFHTYALKWTPDEYVFYFDGKPTWATNAGGTCKTPCYLNISTHSIQNKEKGPYKQPQGVLTGGEFIVDYVRVYQNKHYEKHQRTIESFGESK